jgi:protein-L-isoaspartate(D-aspartate) O-methyltransferase
VPWLDDRELWVRDLLFNEGDVAPTLLGRQPRLGEAFGYPFDVPWPERLPTKMFSERVFRIDFFVAMMTDLLELKPNDVILEIGTGLGYQAAVLAELAGKVYSVEIIDELGQRAIQRLKRQGYSNVEVRIGNGYSGWPEHAPFDKVIVTAAPDLIPPPLINQLKSGGKMVIPVGLPEAQQLVVAERDLHGRFTMKEIMPVLFSKFEGNDEPAFRAS